MRMTVSFEELAYSNMIVVEALVELLTEHNVLSRADIEERVKKLKKETSVNLAVVCFCSLKGGIREPLRPWSKGATPGLLLPRWQPYVPNALLASGPSCEKQLSLPFAHTTQE